MRFNKLGLGIATVIVITVSICYMPNGLKALSGKGETEQLLNPHSALHFVIHQDYQERANDG
jgi:hypothetical protein